MKTNTENSSFPKFTTIFKLNKNRKPIPLKNDANRISSSQVSLNEKKKSIITSPSSSLMVTMKFNVEKHKNQRSNWTHLSEMKNRKRNQSIKTKNGMRSIVWKHMFEVVESPSTLKLNLSKNHFDKTQKNNDPKTDDNQNNQNNHVQPYHHHLNLGVNNFPEEKNSSHSSNTISRQTSDERRLTDTSKGRSQINQNRVTQSNLTCQVNEKISIANIIN